MAQNNEKIGLATPIEYPRGDYIEQEKEKTGLPVASTDGERTAVGSVNSRSGSSDHKHGDDSEKRSDTASIDEGVNVKKAEEDFDQLRRTLSQASSKHRSLKASPSEMEEAEDDDFNLLDYMRGSLESRDQAGLKHKEVGVTWSNLTVVGAGGMKMFIRTFPNAVQEFVMAPIIMYMMKFGNVMKPKNLIENFNGSLRPGEMCLVLGRPGSGCSTFLKSITNQRETYMAVNGDVRYAGVDAIEFGKKFSSEVVYNQENDDHFPSLTVGQTLMFALRTKTPGKRLPEQKQKEFRNEVLELLLRMLNISHTRNTKVGNSFIRGVSGGERKRVSIAEMMTTRAVVLSWDNSTRGLDASTALDYAKSLRIMTNVFKTTTFVSLYQAGEGIFEQFDKIMVIDNGRQVFFGPRESARQYFIDLGFRNLPRQTSADYVTGCTDKNERQFQDGRSEDNVPSTPEKLEEAYLNSEIYRNEMRQRDEYEAEMEKNAAIRQEFEQAVLADKRKGVPKTSPYTVSFASQVWALAQRQFLLRIQDRVGTGVQVGTAIIIALIAGSLFYQLPQTSDGAFTRGGVLFIALLFNAFGAFNELPTQMTGRAILRRQGGYGFYRPAAFSLASTLADIPINSLQILAFGIIIYFMSGLVYTGGAFMTFYITIYAGFLALAAFFRLLGCGCSSFDVASRLAAFLVSGMVLFSGYLIPVFNMKRWLFWIYYLNPLAYGFSALMSNEFKRFDITCAGSSLTPRNVPGVVDTYPNELGANQVCTLPGAQAGSSVIPGRDYLSAAFDYNVDDQWRNFGILLVFFFGFTVLQGLALEFLSHGAGMPAITVFLKENAERKKLNEALRNRKQNNEEQDLAGLIQTKKPFTWENLSYEVPVPGGKRQLLNDVFGFVKPGTLTALMGASGAGKTTLLDVLANRKSIGVIRGDVLIDGRKLGKDFQRGTAYAEQQDEHEWTATAREAMRFSAELRQPASVSKEEKYAYVEEIIALLEMEDIADAMIGFPGYGLSVEARKRVTIGVELAAKPQLLLFLDEPTSGLDGQSAYNLVRFLRKLAAAGQAILCTIHQPNALLFENFDRLLLLKSGGRTVYFGPIGKDSIHIRNYFAARGAHCPENANMAEYQLDAIGAGIKRRVGNKDWADLWLESEEFKQVKEEIKQLKAESLARPAEENPVAELEFATPFITQLRLVSKRALLAIWRNADYGLTRVFNHVIIALFTALTFFQVGNSYADLQYRVFALFIVTVLPAIVISTIEPAFIMARNTYQREASSKMYSSTVFALGQQISEMPYSILSAVLFFVFFYFIAGFSSDSNRTGYFFAMILVVELFSVGLGQAVAALSPSIFTAAYANPFLLIVLSLFCGVTIPAPNIGSYYQWLYELDPFTRLISGLLSNELYNLRITCSDNEFYTFEPPAGQTCTQWAGAFVSAAGGYLQNGDATASCQYCPAEFGQDFYEPLSISFSNRGRDIGILISFTVFNFIVTIVASRFLRYSNR